MNNIVRNTKFNNIDLFIDIDHNKFVTNHCYIEWLDDTLFVKWKEDLQQSKILAFKSEWWLINCLQKSPIKRIILSPQLGFVRVRDWTIAGAKANKKVFLNSNADLILSKNRHINMIRDIKRLFESFIALCLLFLLSPLIIAIFFGQKLSGNSILVKQWCVGKQGLLFQKIRFALNSSDSNWFNRIWTFTISRLGLQSLPQIINVLRGEMSFIGSCSYNIEEALKLKNNDLESLNRLPGIFVLQNQRSLRKHLQNFNLIFQSTLFYRSDDSKSSKKI